MTDLISTFFGDFLEVSAHHASSRFRKSAASFGCLSKTFLVSNGSFSRSYNSASGKSIFLPLAICHQEIFSICFADILQIYFHFGVRIAMSLWRSSPTLIPCSSTFGLTWVVSSQRGLRSIKTWELLLFSFAPIMYGKR